MPATPPGRSRPDPLTLFFQDDWKLLHNLHFAYGLRYYAQSKPSLWGNLTPRLGFAWSPDKKSTWSIHGHAGLFAARFSARDYAEVLRMDGVERVTSIVYNPLLQYRHLHQLRCL